MSSARTTLLRRCVAEVPAHGQSSSLCHSRHGTQPTIPLLRTSSFRKASDLTLCHVQD